VKTETRGPDANSWFALPDVRAMLEIVRGRRIGDEIPLVDVRRIVKRYYETDEGEPSPGGAELDEIARRVHARLCDPRELVALIVDTIDTVADDIAHDIACEEPKP
jgi:hypothetical protein